MGDPLSHRPAFRPQHLAGGAVRMRRVAKGGFISGNGKQRARRASPDNPAAAERLRGGEKSSAVYSAPRAISQKSAIARRGDALTDEARRHKWKLRRLGLRDRTRRQSRRNERKCAQVEIPPALRQLRRVRAGSLRKPIASSEHIGARGRSESRGQGFGSFYSLLATRYSLLVGHSARNAAIGSILAARRAGSRAANSATATSSEATNA
jgi:hypothetical protein